MGATSSTQGEPVTFTYFPVKARGFPILLALEVGNVNYNAKVVQLEDWPAMKQSGVCPFGYMPLLELPDGTRLNESQACLLAAGIRGNLLGSTETAQCMSAMLGCKAAEIFTEFTQKQPTRFTAKNWSGEKTAALGEWKTQKNAGYLAQFEALCRDDGMFTLDGNTIGELSVFSLLYHMKVCGCVEDLSPKLSKFYERVLRLPAVKKCCENQTKMGEQADYVVPIPLDDFEGTLKIVGPHYAQIVCAETAAKYDGRDVSLDRKMVPQGAKHLDRVKFTVTADRYGLPQASSATLA